MFMLSLPEGTLHVSLDGASESVIFEDVIHLADDSNLFDDFF
jgi:hypothetical protein